MKAQLSMVLVLLVVAASAHLHCFLVICALLKSLLQMFRLLWLYSALYDLTGTGARGPKYPFPEAWRFALGQIAVASPFAVVGGGSETSGASYPIDYLQVHMYHILVALCHCCNGATFAT